MRSCWAALALGLLFAPALRADEASTAAVPATVPEQVCTRQSEFYIPFRVDPTLRGLQAPVEVQLHVSTDRGQSWQLYTSARPDSGRFLFRAPRDGLYWFLVRTRNGLGRIEPTTPPAPELMVLVDTEAPRLEFRAERGSAGEVRATWKAEDASLKADSVRLWYLAPGAGERWRQALAVEPMRPDAEGTFAGEAMWWSPEALDALRLRVEVSDAAGNLATAQAEIPAADPSAARPGTTPPTVAAPPSTSVGPPPAGTASTITPLPDIGSGSAASATQPAPASARAPAASTASESATGDPSGSWSTPGTTRPGAGEPPVVVPRETLDPRKETPAPPVAAEWPAERSSTPPGVAPRTVPGPQPNLTARFPDTRVAQQPGLPPLLGEPVSRGIADADPPAPQGERLGPPPGFGTGGQFVRSPATEPAGESLPAPPGQVPTTRPASTSTRPETVTVPSEEFLPPPAGERAPASSGAPPMRVESSPPPATDNVPGLPAGVRPRMVNSRRFELEYDVESIGPSGIGRVELWGTLDGGRTWLNLGTDPDNRSPYVVTVDAEGIYGFRMVVETSSGLRSAPPRPGDLPELWVGVDLTPPLARLVEVEPQSGDRAGEVLIRWEASDTLLAARPVALAFAESPEGPWATFASGLTNSGRYVWRVDNRVPESVYFRLEVRDEAANVTTIVSPRAVSLERVRPRGTILNVRPLSEAARRRELTR